MRNWYGRKYVVICEPVAVRRGRMFERKLLEIEQKGYSVFSEPHFFMIDGAVHGVVLMVAKRKM